MSYDPDDDKRGPEVKIKLGEAFAAANLRAEIEVYPNALHGWCIPDSKAGENKLDADRAWSIMTVKDCCRSKRDCELESVHRLRHLSNFTMQSITVHVHGTLTRSMTYVALNK